MKYALKEWNTTIEALSRGLIVAIWRKGGIDDIPNVETPYESFNVEKEQFIFFPTFADQNPNKVKNAFWYLFDLNGKPNKDNQIKLKYWAEVEEEITIESLDQLLNLSKELANSEEHLKSSWNLYPNHKGKILILRVYALSNPVLITNSPEYGGYKSWIELKIDIPKAGSKPILPFKEFKQKLRLLKVYLDQARELIAS